ncbi:hypothetical protein PB2503_03292 [Parvularcula bermudensis HTCC2503]|uniref:Thioredoxin domain-containing protein n=1 Tax=Parvularcula bermudensis (strain ATCC BAA-594 / HTCC2503 / KCTC 12087) TaxID=314260 RepID=E0TDH9_PARBH|nr:redoxin domain-containing protein [Parvularcula bermudensis]ADM08734.1 hypothetical protein PB2503_03292 [Parvularcula bermudensis HTCC2503]
MLTAFALSALALLAGPRIGETAPDFTARTTTGETITLSDLSDKRVILEWSNHLCPFVQKHYSSGNMQTLQKRSRADDTVWITVVSSAPGKQGFVTAEEANALTKSRGANPSYVILDSEGDIGRLYEAKTTPHMFVIAAGEQQALRYAGAIDSIPSADKNDLARADNYVEQAMRSLDNDRQIVVPQTKPYGCSVKYGD